MYSKVHESNLFIYNAVHFLNLNRKTNVIDFECSIFAAQGEGLDIMPEPSKLNIHFLKRFNDGW